MRIISAYLSMCFSVLNCAYNFNSYFNFSTLYCMNAVLLGIILYECSVIGHYIVCMQCYWALYCMNTMLLGIVLYECTVIGDYIVWMHCYWGLYCMNAVLLGIILYECSVIGDLFYYTVNHVISEHHHHPCWLNK